MTNDADKNLSVAFYHEITVQKRDQRVNLSTFQLQLKISLDPKYETYRTVKTANEVRNGILVHQQNGNQNGEMEE